ncbi:TolC family protein [Oceanithermus sp.]|uniref:TolC family protein n=1 Tax=Oceanithermus sp. TaxID=2268145 RepID=UPI0025D16B76|nr:TolC family protein [Oceanithermus sp.]
MMRWILAALLLGFAWAAGYPEFERAFLEQNPALIAARAEVETAALKVRALADDPYASPYEREVAADALVRAKARLKERLANLKQQAFRRHAAVVTARAQLDRAHAWTEQTAIAYEAARIKAEEGALAAYEVEKARIAWEDAQLAEARAKAQLEEAEAELRRYGDFEATEVYEVPMPQDLAVEQHPNYVLAELDVRAAERAYRAALGPDTSAQQRDWLKARLASARNRLESTKATLASELDLRLREVQTARDALELKTAALDARREAYAAAKLRYEHGLISKLMLKQAEFALRSAELDHVRAQVNLQTAKLALLPFASTEDGS